MAYSSVPTVVTGGSWSAAQHNTYIRDNFTALWPYTTAGDIAYAATTTTLTRLAIGTEGQLLGVSSSVPAWVSGAAADKYCFIKRVSNQNISNTTQTKISFDTETFDNNAFFTSGSPTVITLPTAGYYRLTGSVQFENTNQRVAIYAGETPTLMAYTMGSSGSYSVVSFNYILNTTSNNVSTYLWVWQDSGSSMNVTALYNVTYMGE